MKPLEVVIDAGQQGALEREVFGTTDAFAIADVLRSLALETTGQTVEAALWYRSSAAAVAGVVLNDARRAVVRAYRPNVAAKFVNGVVRVQRHAHRVGFPCPEPLGGPTSVGGVLGRAEPLLPDPGIRPLEAAEMAASAQGLARLVATVADIDSAGLELHPMSMPGSTLYPAPHSPIFDFQSTAPGAEWIDAIAREARTSMVDLGERNAVAHGDWAARNVRLGPSGLVAVYDWESMRSGPESVAVGSAAATWNAHWRGRRRHRALGIGDCPLHRSLRAGSTHEPHRPSASLRSGGGRQGDRINGMTWDEAVVRAGLHRPLRTCPLAGDTSRPCLGPTGPWRQPRVTPRLIIKPSRGDDPSPEVRSWWEELRRISRVPDLGWSYRVVVSLYAPLNVLITTPRLELRGATDERLEALAPLVAAGQATAEPAPWDDPSPFCEPDPDARVDQWLRAVWRARGTVRADAWRLAFIAFVGDEPVGEQDLTGHDFNDFGVVESTSWVATDYRGRGIGTEMRAAILHLAFEGLGASEAHSEGAVNNVASNAVSERLGDERNGVGWATHQGEPVLGQRWRLTREKWSAGRRRDIELFGASACRQALGIDDSAG